MSAHQQKSTGRPGSSAQKVSPARLAAFEILLRVERDQAYASELLNAPRMDRLSREDRALAHELVMSTLRWQSVLDARIAQYSAQKLVRLDAEVRIALRLGCCQLTRLDRIPAHAAVDESVELVKFAGKRSAAAFANAVLRKIAGTQKPALASASPTRPTEPESAGRASEGCAKEAESMTLAAEFAHPEWMVARWIDMYGYSAVQAICAGDQRAPVAALRLCTPAAEQVLSEDGIQLSPGALLRSARRLLSGELAHSRAFREGHVAVQDEGSQLVAALLGRGRNVLDCCAAPGGKSLAIAARNPQAQITAVELHPHRAKLLAQRLSGCGARVLTGDVREMEFSEKFDCVLADVPCSGTGTLAANPEIKWRLRADALTGLQDLQMSILRAALQALAPGGRLVYSTCSLEPEEGEQVVEHLLRENSLLTLLPCLPVLEELRDSGELAWPEPSSLVRGDCLRTLPGIHPCDGFFAAVLERKA